MKKVIYNLAMVAVLGLSTAVSAQVGINAGKTSEGDPHQLASDAVLHVENKTGESKGVLLPSVSLTSATDQTTTSNGTVTKGLLVWNDGQSGLSPAGYYYWEGTQWQKVGGNSGGVTENLYSANGTLADDRTVTQNNHNLTFSTGTGKFEIEGNTKIASTVSVAPNTAGVPASQLDTNGLATTGGAGRSIRVYNGSGVPDYKPTDYMIVLTNDGVNGNLELPSAKAYPGRIIYLINGTTTPLGFPATGTGVEDTLPFNFGTIATRAGVGFVSTGKTWYTIGR